MNYGKLMKDIRTFELIKQQEIANALGIKVDTYRKYENQIKIIPLKHLSNFCNYFNISIDYILGLSKIKNYNNCNIKIDYNKCATRLKLLRLESGLNQVAFAKQLNYDKSIISKYENNKSQISLSFLYAICKKYKVSADYLLGKIDMPKFLK